MPTCRALPKPSAFARYIAAAEPRIDVLARRGRRGHADRCGRDGGNTKGLSNNHRIWLSSVGTNVAPFFAPLRITDPMSGFFAFRRKKLLPILAKVDPLGFKILFDILLLSGRESRISEIPYYFRNRHAGDSKLDWRVQWDFLIQIVYHLLNKLVPHDRISFVSVGASGAVVQFATLGLCIASGLPSRPAHAAAIGVAVIWNFLLNHYLTFHRDLKFNVDLVRKFLLYSLAVAIGIMLNIRAGRGT